MASPPAILLGREPEMIETADSVAALAADVEKLNLNLVKDTTSTHPTNMKETAIFLQDICLQHRYIRSRDMSAIVEKPERLRAVNIGLAAAMARLEESFSAINAVLTSNDTVSDSSTSDDLAAAIGRMNLANQCTDPVQSQSSLVSVVKSIASVDVLNHPAVKFIHGDVDGDTYLENLKIWAAESHDKILKGGSEIPDTLSQGDLYRTFSNTIYF
jgi:histone deacetylase HOS3